MDPSERDPGFRGRGVWASGAAATSWGYGRHAPPPAGLDLATCSHPSSECFPLTMGEAMACGVPCVATDVGVSAAIIGEIWPGRAPQ